MPSRSCCKCASPDLLTFRFPTSLQRQSPPIPVGTREETETLCKASRRRRGVRQSTLPPQTHTSCRPRPASRASVVLDIRARNQLLRWRPTFPVLRKGQPSQRETLTKRPNLGICLRGAGAAQSSWHPCLSSPVPGILGCLVLGSHSNRAVCSCPSATPPCYTTILASIACCLLLSRLSIPFRCIRLTTINGSPAFAYPYTHHHQHRVGDRLEAQGP